MSLYTDYILHSGIKEMKWGVRRFQYKDGSLTPEGRIRYGVKNRSTNIRKKASNSYGPFRRESLNMDAVKSRGQLTDEEARQCVRLANKMFNKSYKVEPEITKDVVDAVSSAGSNMYGMSHRIKQPSSLAAKIGADAKEKSLDFEEAASGIKDTIRYTSIAEDDDFVSNYETVKSNLEAKGYREVRCKNFFEKFKNGEVQHKSVQSVFENQNGVSFEIQFQTPESQAAKELKIPIYNERRKKGISDDRAALLDQRMHDLAEQIPDPKDIDKIKTR